MNKKSTANQKLNQQEKQLIEGLRAHPQILDRVQRILEIVDNAQAPSRKADEVEAMLVEQMRQLGNESLGQWAAQVEERVSRQLREQDPSVRSRKKKS